MLTSFLGTGTRECERGNRERDLVGTVHSGSSDHFLCIHGNLLPPSLPDRKLLCIPWKNDKVWLIFHVFVYLIRSHIPSNPLLVLCCWTYRFQRVNFMHQYVFLCVQNYAYKKDMTNLVHQFFSSCTLLLILVKNPFSAVRTVQEIPRADSTFGIKGLETNQVCIHKADCCNCQYKLFPASAFLLLLKHSIFSDWLSFGSTLSQVVLHLVAFVLPIFQSLLR